MIRLINKIDLHKLHDYEKDVAHSKVNFYDSTKLYRSIYNQQVQREENHMNKARTQAKKEAKKRKKYNKLVKLFDDINN